MHDLSEFRFKEQACKEWEGRYNRIVGSRSVFKLKSKHKYHGFWPIIEHVVRDEIGLCLACETDDIHDLISAVNKVKETFIGRKGGTFQINEHGQVLVPIYDSNNEKRKVFYVGDCKGNLLFKSPITDEIIDLSSDEGLKVGSRWDKPYVGMPYNLSQRNKIYCRNASGILYPIFEDKELIKRIRMIRRWGPVRFIVNPYGIALMKHDNSEYDPDKDEDWLPHYIGRVNYEQWFLKGE